MSDTATRSARLETRIAPETLNLAKSAAAMQGRSLSDFVAIAVREAAQRTIEDAQVIRLSLEGQRRFAELLTASTDPDPGLLKAVEAHRRLLGEP